MKWLNSHTCPPRNTRPRKAVTKSQVLPCFMSPRWIAAKASTIARLDISRSKVLNDVNGMFRISWGHGPTRLLPLQIRYLEISDPNRRHYEPMKAQNAILRLSSPMLVACAWLISDLKQLVGPAIDPGDHDRHATQHQPHLM